MRKLVLFLILFSSVFVGAYAQAKIQFSEVKHDFGNIKEVDGPASHVFAFKNTGNAPLIIQNVETSCGCTSPDYSKEPVLPGKSGFVKATFDPTGRPHTFDKSLTVISNAETNRVVLGIKGNVDPKVLTIEEQYPFAVGQVRMKNSILELYRISSSSLRTENLDVINTGTTPAIVSFENVPAHITVKAEPVSIPAGAKGVIQCTYNAAKKKDFGLVTDAITVKVKAEKGVLTVRATLEEDFSALTAAELAQAPVVVAKETNHNFGKVKKGNSVTGNFEITNDGKSDLIIRKITNDCDCVKSSIGLTTIKPGKTTTLKLELTATDLGDKFYGTTITVNSPKQRQYTFYMTGTVEN
jgi:ribosomal protein L30E